MTHNIQSLGKVRVDRMIDVLQWLASSNSKTFMEALKNLGYSREISPSDIRRFQNFKPEVPIDTKSSPFFCLTSNVDAHFWVQPHDYFETENVCQIHGSVEVINHIEQAELNYIF